MKFAYFVHGYLQVKLILTVLEGALSDDPAKQHKKSHPQGYP